MVERECIAWYGPPNALSPALSRGWIKLKWFVLTLPLQVIPVSLAYLKVLRISGCVKSLHFCLLGFGLNRLGVSQDQYRYSEAAWRGDFDFHTTEMNSLSVELGRAV